jgi:hypothetical protein
MNGAPGGELHLVRPAKPRMRIFGALQVGQDGDELAEPLGGGADVADALAVLFLGAVGEVEAEDVDAGRGALAGPRVATILVLRIMGLLRVGLVANTWFP